jgi:hypothetical protein
VLTQKGNRSGNCASNLREPAVSFDEVGESVWQVSCVPLELLTEQFCFFTVDRRVISASAALDLFNACTKMNQPNAEVKLDSFKQYFSDADLFFLFFFGKFQFIKINGHVNVRKVC